MDVRKVGKEGTGSAWLVCRLGGCVCESYLSGPACRWEREGLLLLARWREVGMHGFDRFRGCVMCFARTTKCSLSFRRVFVTVGGLIEAPDYTT